MIYGSVCLIVVNIFHAAFRQLNHVHVNHIFQNVQNITLSWPTKM